MDFSFKSGLIVFAFCILGCSSLCVAQAAAPAAEEKQNGALQNGPTLLPLPSASEQSPDPAAPGSINGMVVDQSGAAVAGARVSLTHPGEVPASAAQSSNQEALSGGDGQFFLARIDPGNFQLTITSSGFAAQTFSGTLHAGQVYILQPIALAVAASVTDVEVHLTRVQVAQEQMKDEEKQRVFGIIPNFYVTYDPHPLPLNMRQKYNLAWKTTIDPFTFAMVGAIAGVQQADNAFSGYGQGAQGYGKRYGASFADIAIGTFLGGAVFPAVFKQDPRYYYKGTGSTRSRFFYAIANAVICKGDNGRWQTNYSNILGNLAAGGISNLYYPAQNRNGPGLTLENGLIGIGSTAAASVFEEFFMKKLTSNVPRNPASH
ncbi:MAG: carboxypeptidase-like regulatory domain-containing protein [Candidatus Sulfotelmatobacter sp.]